MELICDERRGSSGSGGSVLRWRNQQTDDDKIKHKVGVGIYDPVARKN